MGGHGVNLGGGKIGIERHPEVLRMISEAMTVRQIADSLRVTYESVRRFAKNRGLEVHKQPQRGEHHPNWKTGIARDRSGYLLMRVEKDGPYGYLIRAIAKRGNAGTDSSGKAPIHRIEMHKKLGRQLLPGEVVDHIDGNNQNNDPANLRVFASNADHLRETLKGKVPKWTPEGKARMTGRPLASRNKPRPHESSGGHSRNDGLESPSPNAQTPAEH